MSQTQTASAPVTTTAPRPVSLRPSQKRALLTELRTYAELKSQADAIKLAMDKHKAKVATLREEIGETNLEVEGFKVSYVTPTRKELDKQLLLAQGVTIGQIENATVVKPVKPYVKISLPGEAEREW